MSFVRPAELRTPHLSVGRLRVEAAASGCAAAGGAALRRRDVLSDLIGELLIVLSCSASEFPIQDSDEEHQDEDEEDRTDHCSHDDRCSVWRFAGSDVDLAPLASHRIVHFTKVEPRVALRMVADLQLPGRTALLLHGVSEGGVLPLPHICQGTGACGRLTVQTQGLSHQLGPFHPAPWHRRLQDKDLTKL